MTIINIDPDFFFEFAKLPSEVIALILGFLQKCMLPYLLYFRPIKEIVASVILSDVDITKQIERHKGSQISLTGYGGGCYCSKFQITASNLMKGIEQLNMYPKSIYIYDME